MLLSGNLYDDTVFTVTPGSGHPKSPVNVWTDTFSL